MSLWKQSVDMLYQRQAKPSIVNHLGIEILPPVDDCLQGRMPVDERTHQPLGILHGGASVVLAETLGSIAGNLAVAPEYYCVGMEVNANHLAVVTQGWVMGTARALHLGRSSQVWDIRIHSEHSDKLVCIARLTLAVLAKPANPQ